MQEPWIFLLGIGIGIGVSDVAMWAAPRFYAWCNYLP
jgi:hypothetical protein